MNLLLTLLLLLPAPRAAQGPPVQNEVPGLKLTANQTAREGQIIVVKADCDGLVAFDVVPVGDFTPNPIVQDKQVLLAPPPPGGAIVVVAVGYTGGKLTGYAKSFITRDGPAPGPSPPGPTPTPTPTPPADWKAPAHVYFFLPPASGDPNVAAAASSQATLNALRKAGVTRHVLPANDPLAERVRAQIDAAGGAPCFVLLDSGKPPRVLAAGKLTATIEDALSPIRKAVGQ